MTGKIQLDQEKLLADEPVSFSVVGCTPGETITVRASWPIGGQPVQTEGQFTAQPDGIVDPARQESTGGTYAGTEPHGLWWSVPGPEVPRDPDLLGPWPVTVTASGRDWADTAVLVRRKIDPSVRVHGVRSGRLRGILFLPEKRGPHPTVIVFSGSGGGLGGLGGVTSEAALLASRGFAALALAYFKYDDLPGDLVEIPLEYFGEAIDWLRTQSGAAIGSIGVMGASRGGELALLLGSVLGERISAVVAKVPSGVAWSGISTGYQRDAAAWTLAGQPVPSLRGVGDPAGLPVRDGGIALAPGFEARLAAATAAELEAAEIPVERCGGPVLLVSAGDDAMWPSAAMAQIAADRARSRGARFPVRHISYPGAGHAFPAPAGFPIPRRGLHPIRGDYFAYGGTQAANARASAQSWAEILAFLRGALAPPG